MNKLIIFKLLFVCIFVLSIVFFLKSVLFRSAQQHPRIDLQHKDKPTGVPLIQKKVEKSSVFVPYWALQEDNLSSVPYDTIYYFGVTVDEQGINTEEPGYQILTRQNCPNDKTCIVVLRMLNDATTESVLQNAALRRTIIQNTIALTDTYFYSGIALNIEISGLIDKELTDSINTFVQEFYTATKANYKTLSFIAYGDLYYREKPYDMAFINAHCDEVMIMAYDFSKSYGEPGPNFPFVRRSPKGEGGLEADYKYDFKQMIADYTSEVSPDKLTVIFGMFGYDWTLNKQGTPLKRAEAKSVASLQLFVDSLKKDVMHYALRVTRNNAEEPKIEYTDDLGQKHVIWYEDEDSVAVKNKYLQEQGINNVSYWAYSYY